MLGSISIFLVIILAAGLIVIKVFKEYERGVVFRLGRLAAFRGPGLSFVIPFIEKMVRVDLRTLTLNVSPQDVITRDNVSVKVAAVIYFRVVDPNSALTQVEKYLFAISQLAQTTLRSVCGQAELDQILSQRERINAMIQEIVDAQTSPWGIKVSLVAVKDIDLPQDMQRAMAKQAEAERERRAKVIHAEGEFQASQNYPMRRRFWPHSRHLFTSVFYKRSLRWPSKKIIQLSFQSRWICLHRFSSNIAGVHA